jgi:excinuclease ABC subunit C
LKRSRGTFTNELEKIEGIGKATAALLLKEFRSVNKIKQLPLEELVAFVGASKAGILYRHFEKQKEGAVMDKTNVNE